MTTPWHLDGMAAFDLETTSIDQDEARIVTAAHVTVDGSGVRPSVPTTWLVNPGVPIPDQAAAIHGVTTERAQAEGIPAGEAVAHIAATIARSLTMGLPIVAYNAAYDVTVLDRECRRHSVPTVEDRIGGPFAPVIDPILIDWKHGDKRPGRRTLEASCHHYQVALDGAHDATFDAVAAARLAWRLGQIRPELASMSLADLHTAQVEWALERATSTQARLRSQSVGRPVDGSWPLRRVAAVTP